MTDVDPINTTTTFTRFVAAHDELEEILGSGVRELSHTEVVDVQQRDGCEFGDVVLPNRCYASATVIAAPSPGPARPPLPASA